ncbi:MAG: TraR/DksA C4-type zinc finger protein [Acidobacteriota bacterium]
MANTKTAHERLSDAQLDELRAVLNSKRAEVQSLYRHDVKAGQESLNDNADDFADRANNSYNRDINFTLSDGERQLIIAIDDAIVRFEAGSYGSCTNCGTAIGLARLTAVPWAEFCIDCAEKAERGMLD